MASRKLYTMKDHARVVCLKDTMTEHYGFLLLKKREVKDPRLTKGNTYKWISLEVVDFGNVYCGPVESKWITIIDDQGCRQTFQAEIFQALV